MLFAGSTDGISRVTGLFEAGACEEQRVLESGQAYRLDAPAAIDGLLAATADGLYHSSGGDDWTDLGVPERDVYAVGVSPDGRRLYAGTRPARIFEAERGDAAIDGELAWRELDAFSDHASADDWGIERHDDTAQVRDVVVAGGTGERLVAGVEVGGVYVSDDGGETWVDRSVEGFDAPHTDDIHHVLVEADDTFTAATGSGLYRTTDAGRSWRRLDSGHRQRYFRESVVHDGVLYAGGSPTPPNGWTDDRDHALFASAVGTSSADVRTVELPANGEVAVGWCETPDGLVGVTNQGTLLHREAGEWRSVGAIRAPADIHGRCIPLAWL